MKNISSNNDISFDEQTISIALKALMEYQKTSMSMRRILRDMRNDSPSEQITSHEPLVFGVIRHLNTIDYLLNQALGSIRLENVSARDRNMLRLAIFTARWIGSSITIDFSDGLNPSLKEVLTRAIKFDLQSKTLQLPKINRYSLRFSHPTFIIETLLKHLGEHDTSQLLEANNRSRIYYLRPNRHREDFEKSIKEVQRMGIQMIPDRTLNCLFRISGDVNTIVTSNLFLNGDVLIHDKASVLAVYALHANRGDVVWDACAAPGMKTQLLAELMENTGKIVASDVYSDRVKSAKKLTESLGVTNISWLHADASKMKVKGAEKILIDAPCSSTGMIQSHPSFKWRLNKQTLMAIMSVQHKILDGILNSYRNQPGTEIVYATCSLLPHEGESQIDSAMSTHDIELIDTEIDGATGYTGFRCSEKVRRLFPHRHGTNGFFIARMRIKH